MSANDIKAGGAYVELGTKDDSLDKGLKAAQKAVEGFASKVESLGKTLMLLGGGIVAPIIGAVKQWTEAGSSLQDLSDRTGLSIQTLTEFGYIAKQTGGSMDGMVMGMKTASETVVDAGKGSKEAAEKLKALGLSAQQLKGKSPDEVFRTLLQQLQKVPDEATRTALAFDVFGRGARDMLPLIKMNAQEVENMRAEYRALGEGWTEGTAKKADTFGDTLYKLGVAMRGVGNAIAQAVLPVLSPLLNQLIAGVVIAREWVAKHADAVITLLKLGVATTIAGAALVGLGIAIKTVAIAMGFLSATSAVAVVAIVAVGAAVLAILEAFGVVQTGFSDIMSVIGIGFSQVWDYIVTTAIAAANAVKDAFWGALEGVRSALRAMYVGVADVKSAMSGGGLNAQARADFDKMFGTGPLALSPEQKAARDAADAAAYTQRSSGRKAEWEAAKTTAAQRAEALLSPDLLKILPPDVAAMLAQTMGKLDMSAAGAPGLPGLGGPQAQAAQGDMASVGGFGGMSMGDFWGAQKTGDSILSQAEKQTDYQAEMVKLLGKGMTAKFA